MSKRVESHNKQPIVVSPSKNSNPRQRRDRSRSPEKSLGIKNDRHTVESTAIEGSSNNHTNDGGNPTSADSVIVMFGDRSTQYIGYDLQTKRLFSTSDVTFDNVVQYQKKEVAALNIFAYIIEKIRSKAAPIDDNSGRYGPKMPLTTPPLPPPLPTCWPPKPYLGESILPSDDLSLKGLPIPNSDDTETGVGVTTSNGPKFKRINGVDQLPAIANTIWSDNLESIVAPTLLFPDIEEEFRCDKVASKPTRNDKVRTSQKLVSAKVSLDLKKKQLANNSNSRVLNPQRCQHISIMLAKFGRTGTKSSIISF